MMSGITQKKRGGLFGGGVGMKCTSPFLEGILALFIRLLLRLSKMFMSLPSENGSLIHYTRQRLQYSNKKEGGGAIKDSC